MPHDDIVKLAEAEKVAKTNQASLQAAGQRAAGLFLSKKAESLNDAVATIVSEDSTLSRHQVDRIAEFANRSAFQAAASQDPNTVFAPADRESIYASLAEDNPDWDLDTAPGAFSQEPDHLYVEDEQADAALEALFTGSDAQDISPLHSKVAEHQLFVETESLVHQLEAATNRLQNVLNDAGEEFYGQVKQACMIGDAGFLQITKAVGDVAMSQGFAKRTMDVLADRYEADQGPGFAWDLVSEQEKLASAVVVNTDHPLVRAFANYERAAMSFAESSVKLAQARQACKLAQSNLAQ